MFTIQISKVKTISPVLKKTALTPGLTFSTGTEYWD